MTTAQVLQALRPGAEWTVSSEPNGVETIDWRDLNQSRPTDGEIRAYVNATAYVSLRANAYPSIGDQLDAVMKGGQALLDMQAACMAVKAKYPKP